MEFANPALPEFSDDLPIAPAVGALQGPHKEAETTQNQYQHSTGVEAALSYLARFLKHPALGGPINRDFRGYLKSRWANPGYLKVQEDDDSDQMDENSVLHPHWGGKSEPPSMR